MWRMAMESWPSASVTTTGRLTTASVSRMATCGWLITGGGAVRAVSARVGDRERAAAHLVRRQPVLARTRGEVLDAGGQTLDGELLRVADHGHDQPALTERDRDAEVDRVIAGDGLVRERRVQVGELAQRVDGGAGDDREERRAEPPPLRIGARHVRLH